MPCWCITLYHLNDRQGTLTSEDACVPHRECFQLRVAEYTSMMWDSRICLLYIKVLFVLCAFVCHMTVMCWLEKNRYFCGTSSFILRNSKFVHCTQKCILCYWSVWYLLEQILWQVQKYVHVAVTLIYTKKNITTFLLSVVLSALCHHKRLAHVLF